MIKKQISLISVLSMLLFSFSGCSIPFSVSKIPYGVYLSATYEELPKNLSCETLVIDAQSYSAREIKKLKKNNDIILSYLNIGSLEEFRDYYADFQHLALWPYENWTDEYWIDVTDKSWQAHITEQLAPELIHKGIDGFFIDNTDVYYNFPGEEQFEAITHILSSLKATGARVIVNGGDTYITKYMETYGNLDGIIDGVNQECVMTNINWDNNTLEPNTEDAKNYYLNYLHSVYELGKDVYILEYTEDEELSAKAKETYDELGYILYISESIDLK